MREAAAVAVAFRHDWPLRDRSKIVKRRSGRQQPGAFSSRVSRRCARFSFSVVSVFGAPFARCCPDLPYRTKRISLIY